MPCLKTIFIISLIISITILSSTTTLKIDIYKQRIIQHDILNSHIHIKSNPWTNDSVTLYKFMDEQYYGLIKIGQPAKEFKMIFDMTWADSWVPSQHCGLLEIACMMHTRYDNLKSSTYQENGTLIKINAPTFSLRGFVSKDNFHLSHLQLVNQSFVEMTHMSLKPFALTKADGVIGLGFSSLTRIPGTKPFFYNMIKQKLIPIPVITLYMNRDQTTEKAGKLILGGRERKHVKGEIISIPVIEKNYWMIAMDRVVVDVMDKSYPFCSTGCKAVIDTSTNTITGSEQEIEKINYLLKAKIIFPEWPGRYMVNCREYAKLADVHIVLRGREFTINSKYYIQHLTYKGFEMCLSPFKSSTESFWKLGGAFLMQFYTEYNFDKAQIAIGETVF